MTVVHAGVFPGGGWKGTPSVFDFNPIIRYEPVIVHPDGKASFLREK